MFLVGCGISFFNFLKPIVFILQKIYTLTMECETKPFVNLLITPFVEIIVTPWLTLHVYKTCVQFHSVHIFATFTCLPRSCWHTLKCSVKSSSAWPSPLFCTITPIAALACVAVVSFPRAWEALWRRLCHDIFCEVQNHLQTEESLKIIVY